jgi:hypothetical protein
MKMSPMIDPKTLRIDTIELLSQTGPLGLTVDEASKLLAGREHYDCYPPDYVREWTESMLHKLYGQGAITCKDDRYFSGTSPAVS